MVETGGRHRYGDDADAFADFDAAEAAEAAAAGADDDDGDGAPASGVSSFDDEPSGTFAPTDAEDFPDDEYGDIPDDVFPDDEDYPRYGDDDDYPRDPDDWSDYAEPEGDRRLSLEAHHDANEASVCRADGPLMESRRRRGCHVDSPYESRRRRGCHVASPWETRRRSCHADSPRRRVAAAPRLPRG